MSVIMHLMCEECFTHYTDKDPKHVCGENGEYVVFPFELYGPEVLWDNEY
jgi:hypothetical protein